MSEGRYLTVTRAAGRLSFEPNQKLDFPDDVAAELLAAGSVVDLQAVAPESVELEVAKVEKQAAKQEPKAKR